MNGLADLFIKEKFINTCPKDLGIFFHEGDPTSIVELAKLSEKYLTAHEKSLNSIEDMKNAGYNEKIDVTKRRNIAPIICYNCNCGGHIARDCPKTKTEKPNQNTH